MCAKIPPFLRKKLIIRQNSPDISLSCDESDDETSITAKWRYMYSILVFKARMAAWGMLQDTYQIYSIIHSDNTKFLTSHADQNLLTYKITFTSWLF